MSSKITHFMVLLLVSLCLVQQFETTSAGNSRRIRRVLSREEIAARKELHQKSNNQLSYINKINEDEDDNEKDNRHGDAEDGNDESDGDADHNQVLRDENTENAALEGGEGNAAGNLANAGEGTDVEGRARRRRGGRRGGPRRRRAGRRGRRSRRRG